MEPLMIALALLGAWGISKLVRSSQTGFPVVIPPTEPWPEQTPPGALCPPNLPPPPDVTAMTAPFPLGLTPWAYKQLKYPKGTRIIDVLDGQLIVARIETHYHPPGTPGVTATGCHKGCTVYRPTMPWVEIDNS